MFEQDKKVVGYHPDTMAREDSERVQREKANLTAVGAFKAAEIVESTAYVAAGYIDRATVTELMMIAHRLEKIGNVISIDQIIES